MPSHTPLAPMDVDRPPTHGREYSGSSREGPSRGLLGHQNFLLHHQSPTRVQRTCAVVPTVRFITKNHTSHGLLDLRRDLYRLLLMAPVFVLPLPHFKVTPSPEPPTGGPGPTQHRPLATVSPILSKTGTGSFR
jgi:hypothetical protein